MYVYRPRPFLVNTKYGPGQAWLPTVAAAADKTITGVRAAATATAQPGFITEGVVGQRAAATATAQPGFVKIAVTGVRGSAIATAQTGIPKIAVIGVRALTTGTAQPGSVGAISSAVGSRRTLVGVGV